MAGKSLPGDLVMRNSLPHSEKCLSDHACRTEISEPNSRTKIIDSRDCDVTPFAGVGVVVAFGRGDGKKVDLDALGWGAIPFSEISDGGLQSENVEVFVAGQFVAAQLTPDVLSRFNSELRARVVQREEAQREKVRFERAAEVDRQRRELNARLAKYAAADHRGDSTIVLNPYSLVGKNLLVDFFYKTNISESAAIVSIISAGTAQLNSFRKWNGQDPYRIHSCIVKVLGATQVLRDGKPLRVPNLELVACL